MPNLPETITFQRDGKDHVALVSPRPQRAARGALIVKVDGVRYAIYIPLGLASTRFGFIAKPIQT